MSNSNQQNAYQVSIKEHYEEDDNGEGIIQNIERKNNYKNENNGKSDEKQNDANNNNNNNINNINNNNNKDIVENSNNAKLYTTPAIKKWYILCGICPEFITFTKSEKRWILIYKIGQNLCSKILSVPGQIAFMRSLQFPMIYAIIFGTAMGLGAFFQHQQVELIISKNVDAIEVLRNKEMTNKLDAFVQQFNCSFVKLFIKEVIAFPMIFFLAFPIYLLFTMEEYILLGLFIAYQTVGMINHCQRLGLQEYSTEFVRKKIKNEIIQYIKSIEDIILNTKDDDDDVLILPPKKNMKEKNNQTKVEYIQSLIRRKQLKYQSRMLQRKKLYKYHPFQIVVMTITSIVLLVNVATIHSLNHNIIIQIISYIFSVFMIVMMIYTVSDKATELSTNQQIFINAKKKLEFIDFMRNVELKLQMRYELFDTWLEKQKEYTILHIFGFPLNGELVKRVIFAITSLCSIAVVYVGREMVLGNSQFNVVV